MVPRTVLRWGVLLLSSALLRADAAVRFVVTDLFLVSADSLDSAVQICESNPHAQSIGSDWSNANAGRVLQLCIKRERLEQVLSSLTAPTSKSSAQPPPRKIVQRIAVYTTKPECPPSETELFRPQQNVLVCVRRVSGTIELLTSGNFLSDVWVSKDLNYNSNVPGWTLLATSVLEPADGWLRSLWQWVWNPAYSGAFISFQKPLVPIRELQLLAVGQTTGETHENSCLDRLGDAWEQAGDEVIDVDGKQENRAVLCLRRGDATPSDRAALALSSITVVQASGGGCVTSDGSATTQTLPVLSTDLALCLQWSDGETSSDVVEDLRLEATGGEEALKAGQFRLVSPLPLSGDIGSSEQRVFLYAQRGWSQLMQAIVDDHKDAGLNSRPPLTARTVTSTDGKPSLTYKILQIADLHYSGDPTTSCNDVPTGMKSKDCSEALMTKFVNELLDLEKPDFVAFTGDNVQVYDKDLRQKAVDAVVQGVEDRGIPYGVIFGNHDDQKGFTREKMMDMFVHKPHAYSRRGPKSVDGVGNYEIGVQAPVDGAWGKAGTDVFRMYFIDSHAYPDESKYPDHVSKYDWIKPSQVAYYRTLSAKHAAANNRVPAVMFFHIPLPEYALDSKSLRTGEHLEGVQSSGVNMNLFSSLVEVDEVKATFCGHDHVNDYCYKREGVQLCYGGGAGFGTAYGWSSVARRARVIEWSVDAANRRTIRSWKRMFGDIEKRQVEEVLYAEARPTAQATLSSQQSV